jgi:D-alanine-D-alanine ligase
MKNIAILTGGYSAEFEISIKSAAVVAKHLSVDKYYLFTIVIDADGWYEQQSKTAIDKNDFSLTINGVKTTFDAAFVALHGSPIEDGKLQGYLEEMNVSYTCCDGFVSALTMNKIATRKFLGATKVKQSTTLHYHKNEIIDKVKIEALGFPVFVKPNAVGSSYGVHKVKSMEEIDAAIADAFSHDDEVLIEEFIAGREFGNGVYMKDGKPVALPVTEIIPETEFFDYEAKYLGKSKEITPADLSPALTQKCQELSVYLYKELGCKGFVRMDYILKGEDFYFLEVNTVPGMSEASIIPQQVVASGMSLKDFFESSIDELLS